jgi:hypothetical protein
MKLREYDINKLECVLIIALSLIYFGCTSDVDGVNKTYTEDKVNKSTTSSNDIDTKDASIILMIDSNQDFELKNIDFMIFSDSTKIVLGESLDSIVTTDKIINKRSADSKIANDIIVYDNYKLKINISDKIIIAIELTTSDYKTNRGIKVGDTLSQVIDKYGDYDKLNNSDLREFYMYYFEDKILTFCIDKDNVIVGIKYEFV